MKGSITVICGSMFSGKSEELIRFIRRSEIAQLNFVVFKPQIDTRYSKDEVISHSSQRKSAIPVSDSADLLLKIPEGVEVIGIDEAQFFDNNIVEVVVSLANRGVKVFISGLDMDYRGIPFGPMPLLLSVADHIEKLHAVCAECKGDALFTHRKLKSGELVLLGAQESYEPLCRACYVRENL